jgi:hypothetical protein
MDPVIQLENCHVAKNPSGDFEIVAQYRETLSNGSKGPNQERWKIIIPKKDASKLRDFLNHHLS